MLARSVIDIQKNVERQMGLSKLLMERNQDLSAKNLDLEVALEEKNKEILAERRNVETHLKTIKNKSAAMEELKNRYEKLEKDMEQMKLTAQETCNSSSVSDLSTAISINARKMEQFEIARTKQAARTKELKDRSEKLEKDMELMRQSAEETRNSSVVSEFSSAVAMNTIKLSQLKIERDQFRKELDMWKVKELQSRMHFVKLVDKNTQLLQQINLHEMQILSEQKTENIEEAGRQHEQRRSTQELNLIEDQLQQRFDTNSPQLVTKDGQIQNFQTDNISGKFVFVFHCWKTIPKFFSSDNAEYITYTENNLGRLAHNISSYKKELLVWTHWWLINATGGSAKNYAKLLSLCQEWKRLRPDGEIHFIYYYKEDVSPPEPNEELFSLLTTCNKFLLTTDVSFVSTIRQYWPKFVDSILSKKTKKKYPN